MKKILLASIAFTVVGLIVFGFISRTNSNTNATDTADNYQLDVSSAAIVTVQETNEAVSESKDPSNFFLSIGNRFNSIKKEDLKQVRSFSDLIGQEHARRIVEYKSLSVIVLEDDVQTNKRIKSKGGEFTPEQLELLQSADYTSNFLIWADYREFNKETEKIEYSTWTPYLSVVPETQALYSDGNEALISYLKENSKVFTEDENIVDFNPGKLYFTVTKEGEITNIEIKSSSGYTTIDEKLKQLITTMSGKWEPAKNIMGEKVDQQLVISFGNMGC